MPSSEQKDVEMGSVVGDPDMLYTGNPLEKFLVEIWGGDDIIQVQLNGLVTYTFEVKEAEELKKGLGIALAKWQTINNKNLNNKQSQKTQ